MKKFIKKFMKFRVLAVCLLAILAVMTMVMPEVSFAANATNVTAVNNAPFANLLAMVQAWISGPVVTIISLLAVLMGLAIGIARQSPIAALSGIAFAVLANILPGVITTIIGAVV